MNNSNLKIKTSFPLENNKAMDAVKKALKFKNNENSEVVVFHSVIHHLSELAPNLSLTASSNASVSF